MVLVDGIVYSITALSVVVSISRGLVREILTMVSWGVSAVCLVVALEPLAKLLHQYQLQSPLNWVVSAILIFVGVWLLVRSVNSFIRMVFKGLGITWFDNLLGGAFGLARGLLLSWLIVWSIVLVLGPDHHWVTEAKTPHWLNHWGDELKEWQWDQKSSAWLAPIAPYLEKVEQLFQSDVSSSALAEYKLAKHDVGLTDDSSL